jgi:hypothetical protein
MRHAVVQRTAVLLSFHAPLVDELHAKRALPWLHDDEAALLLRTDPRAWKTDPLRATRLLATLLEELPVSCAVVGVDVARGFFASKPFQHAILHDRLVVDALGDWLLPRAGSVAQLEQAVAMARRARPRRRLRHAGDLARASGVEVVRVPEGTLAFLARSRAALGDTPHEAVAQGARVEAPREPMNGPLEHVLVVGSELSTCAEPLFALLSFARDGKPGSAVVDEARRLGADDDAQELVDDLVREGLLASPPSSGSM